jgi:flagellar hook protein FlgE
MLGTIANIKLLLNDKSVYGYNDTTIERTGMTTNGSKIITGVNTDSLSLGDVVNGTGIPTDSTITAISTTTITINVNCTATSATAVDMTINHDATEEFEDAIEAFEEEVKIIEMYPRLGADYSMSVDQSAYYDEIDAKTYADCTMYEKLIVKAEEYFIASYFLKSEGLKDVSNRAAMREYKTDGQNTTVMSGPTGKQHLSNEYYKKALSLFESAGYDIHIEVSVL